MKKRAPNEAGIHVVGYVENELHRIARGEDRVNFDHKDRLFAEALMILLSRTRPAAPKPHTSQPAQGERDG